ncbi:hypothetical protein FWG95_02370 [Candidatus Saccharibacteria bacterium]|nr:hypothetical protein [Candidatus Saccharibacteria bacterium]
MNPTNVPTSVERAPEQGPNVVPQPNAMPVGFIAANMAPGNPNAAPNLPPSVPDLAPSAPEVAPMGGPEQLSNPETQIGPGQSGGSITQQPVLSTPQPVVVPSTTTTSDDSTTTTSPASAADEDLIEKEWVDKAKQVVKATRDDPHEQAKQVAELMRDYVKKRYGKVVGKAPDDL